MAFGEGWRGRQEPFTETAERGHIIGGMLAKKVWAPGGPKIRRKDPVSG